VRERPLLAVVVLRFQIVIALVTWAMVLGWAAVEACQGVPSLLCRHRLGADCG
jgi:hypothetical protein